MIAAPMPIRVLAAARPRLSFRSSLLGATAVLAVALAGCGSTEPSSSPGGSGLPSGSAPGSGPVGTPGPTASPSPTPLPTPYYTNPPDAELRALIPATVSGRTVAVPQPDEFAYTPGDFGEAYGELGLRFRALQVAYIEQPRLSLYVARVDGEPVTTADLEPHLETAGRYVGIAGLVREPWQLLTIANRVVWVRPEDNATAAGTMIYTWAVDQYVFLMIGVDDAVNRALFTALPGEPAPTPSPRPSSSSGSPAPSATATPG